MSSTPRILIVDDEPQMLKSLKIILERQGYEIYTASDGKQALDLVDENEFEVVLIDIVLPNINGHELLDLFKQRGVQTSTIAMTGYASTDSAVEALRKGAYDYLRKPFENEELLNTVENAIQQQQAKREREQAEEALQKREAELQAKTEQLKKVNTALKVLLQQRENDKKDLEQNVLSNVKQMIMPYLESLKNSQLNTEQSTYVSILESNLNDLVSPFANNLSSEYLDLSPSEIRVAGLVKEGKTNKEMANLLFLSTNTIMFHRHNLRTKLGLKNKGINLRSYLQNLKE